MNVDRVIENLMYLCEAIDPKVKEFGKQQKEIIMKQGDRVARVLKATKSEHAVIPDRTWSKSLTPPEGRDQGRKEITAAKGLSSYIRAKTGYRTHIGYTPLSNKTPTGAEGGIQIVKPGFLKTDTPRVINLPENIKKSPLYT